jgi:hypothetical protein
MKNYLRAAISMLDNFKHTPEQWAETFVMLRMGFHRECAKGLVCSTYLGTDFFHVLLDCIEGRKEWNKKEHKGEYEDNFRKLIELGRAEA